MARGPVPVALIVNQGDLAECQVAAIGRPTARPGHHIAAGVVDHVLVAAVGVHQPQFLPIVAVVVGVIGDLPAIGRPNRVEGILLVGQDLLAGAIRVHHHDAIGAVAIGNKGDLASIRGIRGCSVVAGAVGQARLAAAVAVHDVYFGVVNAVTVAFENDARAVRRPCRRLIIGGIVG